MRETSYIRMIDMDRRINVQFQTEGKSVNYFMIQYELFIMDKWQPVVRYDTAHGFAHKDIMHPDGTKEKIEIHFATFAEALTYAHHDINTNWEKYRDDYQKEVRKL